MRTPARGRHRPAPPATSIETGRPSATPT
jgi:hypothetical protein